jgi:hypothetical protein
MEDLKLNLINENRWDEWTLKTVLKILGNINDLNLLITSSAQTRVNNNSVEKWNLISSLNAELLKNFLSNAILEKISNDSVR